MENMSTQLRYVSAKSLDTLLVYVHQLPYKIEIKGNPIFRTNRWFLFFTLPDVVKEIVSGQLD